MKTHAFQARALQNWAKEVVHSHLLQSQGSSLCEIYCGAGGLDLGKYDRAGVQLYAAVDPDPTALKKTEKAVHAKGDPFRAAYVQADPTQDGFPTLLGKQTGVPLFDNVVCYNGFHQQSRFSTEEYATRLLQVG